MVSMAQVVSVFRICNERMRLFWHTFTHILLNIKMLINNINTRFEANGYIASATYASAKI